MHDQQKILPAHELTSLSAKISSIVFWGLISVGILVAVFMSNELERKITEQYRFSAQRASFDLLHKLEHQSKINSDILRRALERVRTKYSVPALRLELGSYHAQVGSRDSSSSTITETIEVHTTGVGGKATPAYITFYFQSIKEAINTRRKNMLMAMGLFFLTFGVLLNVVLQRILTRPFANMVSVAQHFSEGDHSVRFETAQKNEFGYLGQFINKMIDRLTSQQESLKMALASVREREAELFREKERAEVTLHSIGDGVITTDNQCLVEYMNPTAENLTGWTIGEVQGKPVGEVFELIDEHLQESIPNPIIEAIETGETVEINDNITLIRKDRSNLAIADSAAPIRDKNGTIVGAIMVFHDVEQNRRLTRELNYQASHDALTGLYNRRAFEHELKHALQTAAMGGGSHAVCFLDLDQFKIVNDTCGHAAGDELLKQIAMLLNNQLRDSDVLARLGGDEFAVLLLHCDMKHTLDLAEKLRHAIEEHHFAWGEHLFHIGVSIGVAPITADDNDIHKIMRMVDIACYAAKDKGRNRIHEFRPDDNELMIKGVIKGRN